MQIKVDTVQWWIQNFLEPALADPGFGQGGAPEIFSENLPT